MFDIGFFELLLVGVVGLIVIGPEKLPTTVRTCALWLGRIKRSISETRQEIEQQLGADEIRRELYNEQVLHNLEKMKDTRAELEQRINRWQAGENPDEPADAHSHHSHTQESEPPIEHPASDTLAERSFPPAAEPSNPEAEPKPPSEKS